ncbi:acyltransferase family protein [Caldimonas caldifontis]|uniref:Acyltransferase n=1 Tax=Caldimonas caldifontis TaxID=1452508 RepID=A0A2S5SQA3_9BURK|nr:acyltransferase family protein [Caldimonas caldifontis]PPE64921.1 acyltransferase [Caldimonas caldifontis]
MVNSTGTAGKAHADVAHISHEYRRDIDSLRAFAILPVVLFHVGVGFLPGGFVGVDIFFVISGFLITGIIIREIQEGKFSIARFYERRARRILPALIAVVVLTLICGWVVLRPDELDGLAKSAIAAIAFSSNMWFWKSSLEYFGTAVELEPLLHTWSLAVEEQFYIFFPLLILLVNRLAPKRLGQVVLTVTLVSFAAACLMVYWKPSATFYLLPTRAWELGIGALLAIYPLRTPPGTRFWTNVAGLAGVCLLVLPVLLYSKATPFPGVSALPPCLGAALLIALGRRSMPSVLKFMHWMPLVFIGKISYSLYLVHWPIIVFFKYLSSTTEISSTAALWIFAASFVCAVGSWWLVEQPFRARPNHRHQVFAWSAGAMALVSVVALSLIHVDGLKYRLSFPQQSIVDVSSDRAEVPSECERFVLGEGLCPIGAPSQVGRSYDFVLLGDSHALSLSPAVSEAARSAGRSGLMGSMICPPLLGVTRLLEPRCTEFTESVLHEIAGRPDIKTVILHARWALYESATVVRGEAGGQAPSLLLVRDELDKLGQSPHEVFERGLRRTMELLLASGRDVVVVEGTPEMGWNVPNALLIKDRWGIDHPPAPTLESVQARQAGVKAVFERYKNHPQVRFIDPAPVICSDSACSVEVHGLPAFFDDNHLTRTAAKAWFKDILEREVFGR